MTVIFSSKQWLANKVIKYPTETDLQTALPCAQMGICVAALS